MRLSRTDAMGRSPIQPTPASAFAYLIPIQACPCASDDLSLSST
jgi:hypothetical protein